MKWFRRLIIFGLGCLLLYDSIVNNFHVLEFIIALIMVGLIPIDTVIDMMMAPHNDEEQIKRLREVYKPDDKE